MRETPVLLSIYQGRKPQRMVSEKIEIAASIHDSNICCYLFRPV